MGPRVIVAHPQDVLGFSSVLAGAEVVAVTDGAPPQGPPDGFERACAALGAERAVRLGVPSVLPWRLGAVEAALQTLGPSASVFAPSPLDPNPHHQDVAQGALRVFGSALVQSAASPLEIRNMLSAEAFDRKIALANACFLGTLPDIGPLPQCEVTADGISSVEGFARASLEDGVRASALTHFDRNAGDGADIWALETSAYERERFEGTERLLRGLEPRSILEIGACEGAMTARLVSAFPGAAVRAIEPNAAFAARLRARFLGEPKVEVIEAGAAEVELEADLVLAMEVLYYAGEAVPDLVARMRGRHLLTSYHGPFDRRLSALLEELGWRPTGQVDLPARVERVREGSALLVRRVGCALRLFTSSF